MPIILNAEKSIACDDVIIFFLQLVTSERASSSRVSLHQEVQSRYARDICALPKDFQVFPVIELSMEKLVGWAKMKESH